MKRFKSQRDTHDTVAKSKISLKENEAMEKVHHTLKKLIIAWQVNKSVAPLFVPWLNEFSIGDTAFFPRQKSE